MFLHFDCEPLCGVFFRRSKGGHAQPVEGDFEAEKVQHVGLFLA